MKKALAIGIDFIGTSLFSILWIIFWIFKMGGLKNLKTALRIGFKSYPILLGIEIGALLAGIGINTLCIYSLVY